MARWTPVFSSPVRHRADIVSGVLGMHEVAAVLVDKTDSAYAWLGHYEVHVPSDDALRALRIIEQNIRFE